VLHQQKIPNDKQKLLEKCAKAENKKLEIWGQAQSAAT